MNVLPVGNLIFSHLCAARILKMSTHKKPANPVSTLSMVVSILFSNEATQSPTLMRDGIERSYQTVVGLMGS